MNKNLFFLFLLLPLFSLKSEENLTSLSQQGEAFWDAHDFAAANKIYEPLLARPLPDWQQTRVRYNLGAIQLAGQQINEALNFFQKISPTDLSLPRFGRNLFLDEGIAYLQYAQSLVHASASLDQQSIFVEQSLRALDQAQKLECQGQKEKSSLSCQTSSLLDQWIKMARLQLHAVHQQKRQNWMEQASIESLASFLHHQMQAWLDRFNASQMNEKNASLETAYFSYFLHQAESLMPIWNIFQQKKMNVDQKEAFEQAVAFYINALQTFQQKNVASTLKEWKQGIEALVPLAFQTQQDLQQARLSYEILLLQEELSLSALNALITQFESLKVDKDSTASLEQIKEYLQTSLKELQAQHPMEARFYLLAGFSDVHSLLKEEKNSPAAILQQALDQSNRALQLFFIYEMMTADSSQMTKIRSILKNQQHDILVRATPFIPSVLNEQEMRFHQAKDRASSCQQSPWDQVIPLYDRGYGTAQRADQQLDKAELDSSTIMAYQQQTIKDWQQALKLILNPPQQNMSAHTPQKMTETFSLIQEMYLQDQSQPEQKTEELQSW